jgi:hypothetical protein
MWPHQAAGAAFVGLGNYVTAVAVTVAIHLVLLLPSTSRPFNAMPPTVCSDPHLSQGLVENGVTCDSRATGHGGYPRILLQATADFDPQLTSFGTCRWGFRWGFHMRWRLSIRTPPPIVDSTVPRFLLWTSSIFPDKDPD